MRTLSGGIVEIVFRRLLSAGDVRIVRSVTLAKLTPPHAQENSMKTLLFAAVLMLATIGCEAVTPANLTQSKLESVQIGMTLAEAESVLGTDHTLVFSMPHASSYAWTEGSGDNLRSIALTFGDGKVVQKGGSNL